MSVLGCAKAWKGEEMKLTNHDKRIMKEDAGNAIIFLEEVGKGLDAEDIDASLLISRLLNATCEVNDLLQTAWGASQREAALPPHPSGCNCCGLGKCDYQGE